MFGNVKKGFLILLDSMESLFKQPKLLLPLLIVWVVYGIAASLLFFPLSNVALHVFLQYVLGMTILLSIFMSFAFAMLLVMLKQYNDTKKMRFWGAFKDTFTRHIYLILPFAIFWMIIWLLFTILEILIGGKQSKDEMLELAKNPFALTKARILLRAIMKAIRVVIFFAFPAIIWERKGIKGAIGRGYSILKTHPVEILVAYVATAVIGALFSSPFIVYFITSAFYSSTTAVILTWLYVWLSWSFVIYLEQLFVAGLYKSHLMWEKKGGRVKFEDLKVKLIE